MSDDSHEHGSYYVPEYSWWPILAAIGLFLAGFGSILYFEQGNLGPKLVGAGGCILFLVIISWLYAVIHEDRQGLYDAQMNRTFRWGMIWFIFSDIMLFVCLLGALWYYRLFTFPQLSGTPYAFELLTHYLLWPDFREHWPLLANPDPSQFVGPTEGLAFGWKSIITTLVMLGSGFTLVFANFGLKTSRRGLLHTGLITTFLLIALFLALKIDSLFMAITHFGITLQSGIYGSVVIFTFFIFLLHIFCAFLLLGVIMVRAWLGHFSAENNFSLRVFSWFWYIMMIIWLCIFFSVY